MDVIKCINERRSVQHFSQKAIEFDKICALLDAGANAPSSGNIQDYRFILVTERDIIRGIASHCSDQFWIAEAPIMIVVCADTDRSEQFYGLRGQRLYSIQNAAAATQNILLAAHALGLGACWVGSFDETYLSDILSIPENGRPQAIIPIGYPVGTTKKKERVELKTLVFFNKYGLRIKNLNSYIHEYNKEIEKYVKSTEPKLESAIDKLRYHANKVIEKTKDSMKESKQKR